MDVKVNQTRLVGRQKEIVHLTGRVLSPACRLVTIVGPGGCGKTRLAWHLAELLSDQFAAGAAIIPLDAFDRPEQLIEAIGDILHIPQTGSLAREQQLLQFLRSRELLRSHHLRRVLPDSESLSGSSDPL